MSRGLGTYNVENRARLERERQAALARVRDVKVRLEEVTVRRAVRLGRRGRRGRGIPGVSTAPADSATAAVLTEWADETERVVERVSRELAEAEEAERAAELARHLQLLTEVNGPTESSRSMPKSRADAHGADGPQAAPARSSLKDRLAGIERVVSDLDPDATPAERERVEAVVRALLAERATAPATLITQLKVEVQTIAKAAARRRSDREAARALLRSLDGLVGGEVEDLRRLLWRVVGGETSLVSVDAARVADVRARAIAEEDRRYVAEHLAEAFQDLGYNVDVRFVSDLASGDPGYAYVGASLDHAAEVQLDAGQYSYRLVRASTTSDPRRDTAHEAALCRDIGRVTAAVHRAGVRFTLDGHRPAGDQAVPYVPRAAQRRRQVHREADSVRERHR